MLQKHTFLHNAIIKGDINLVEKLLQSECIDVNAQDASQNTPLHLSILKMLSKLDSKCKRCNR